MTECAHLRQDLSARNSSESLSYSKERTRTKRKREDSTERKKQVSAKAESRKQCLHSEGTTRVICGGCRCFVSLSAAYYCTVVSICLCQVYQIDVTVTTARNDPTSEILISQDNFGAAHRVDTAANVPLPTFDISHRLLRCGACLSKASCLATPTGSMRSRSLMELSSLTTWCRL